MLLFLFLLAQGCVACPAFGQAVNKPMLPVVKDAPKYGRGYIHPTKEVLDKRHAAAFKRHDHRMKHLPHATLPAYDCRTLGFVPPVKDQGQCGSCYQFSGANVCEMAFMKAGLMPIASGGLAEGYGMECQNWGDCNGGDEAQVINWCKTNGLPATADYGPYIAGRGNCRLKPGTKMWQISDWGYCHLDQGQGVAAVQQIKDAIVRFGPVSVAVDASGFDSYSSGVMTGTGHSIDHAVIIVGWKDDTTVKGGGYWIVRNQWGSSWGMGGYAYIGYGAYDIGTEAIWVSVAALPPPPPPTPDPVPTPTPPVPGSLTIKSATVTLSDGTTMTINGTPTALRPDMTLKELFDLLQPATKKPQSKIVPSKNEPSLNAQAGIQDDIALLRKYVAENKRINVSLLGVVEALQRQVETLQRQISSPRMTAYRPDWSKH